MLVRNPTRLDKNTYTVISVMENPINVLFPDDAKTAFQIKYITKQYKDSPKTKHKKLALYAMELCTPALVKAL